MSINPPTRPIGTTLTLHLVADKKIVATYRSPAVPAKNSRLLIRHKKSSSEDSPDDWVVYKVESLGWSFDLTQGADDVPSVYVFLEHVE